MISDKFRCIFIHIPKTAGTSIEYRLQLFNSLQRGVQDHRTVREIEPYGFSNIATDILRNDLERVLTHVKGIVRGKLPRATHRQYRAYFKFAFVRNPWVRAFSWYQNVMRDENHQKQLKISANCTYETFLTDYANQWALQPQLHWLRDRNGRLPLDFIGRFENLAEDFALVSNTLNLNTEELPYLNKSNWEDSYTDFYTDKTRKLVAARYAEEIEYFGYHFDN